MQEPKAQPLNEMETIVRVVVERLRSLNLAPAPRPTAGSDQPLPAASASDSATLRLDHKVIALADLQGHWASIKTLQVDARAVVTPAVRDELRSRGIALQRNSIAARAAGNSSGPRPLLVLAPAAKQATLLRPLQTLATLAASGDCAADLDVLHHHFRGSAAYAIWCTSRPFAASRAAATQASLSAVLLPSIDDLARAIEEASPNTFILDDRRWSSASLGHLARHWSRSFAQ
ncbi:MAG: hypothetical protein KDA45_14845 [Planctomycetales bacterium]|nr:hypothetical protein [Planctomycetales bacterium]